MGAKKRVTVSVEENQVIIAKNIPADCTVPHGPGFSEMVFLRGGAGEGSDSQRRVAWWDATLDASSWWSLNSITALQAAALLCQFNPDNDTYNPELVTTSETGPDDFKRLRREFNDVAKHDDKHRSLSQWHDIAHDRGLKHHSWIDEYKAAMEPCANEKSVQVKRDSKEGVGIDNAVLMAQHKEPTATGSKPKRGRKPGKHKEHLTAILDAIDSWAGESLNRQAMPGPLGESADDEGSFHWLCAKLYPHDFRKVKRTFEEHRAGVCAIAAWAKPDFDTSKAHFRGGPSTGAGSRGLKAKTPSHTDCC